MGPVRFLSSHVSIGARVDDAPVNGALHELSAEPERSLDQRIVDRFGPCPKDNSQHVIERTAAGKRLRIHKGIAAIANFVQAFDHVSGLSV
jgi:hypothetical protein